MRDSRTARMLISREQNRFKDIDASKTSSGQFYTTQEHWLTEPVAAFIEMALEEAPGFLDPFAGEGHLLEVCAGRFNRPVTGLDLHAPRWPRHDSLDHLPITNSIIITNPPYLAKHSASRKGVAGTVARYYQESGRDDPHQTALLRCLNAARFTVAIIPETFLNSRFPKGNLVLVSVLEKNPFEDTENPVCVACFDTQVDSGVQTARVFLEARFCSRLGELAILRKTAPHDPRIRFNDPSGELSLRAVDSTDPAAPIAVLLPEAFA